MKPNFRCFDKMSFSKSEPGATLNNSHLYFNPNKNRHYHR